MMGAWLEVIEPASSPRGCDSLLLGMRIPLDGRKSLSAGRSEHDDVSCSGAALGETAVKVWKDSEGRWIATSRRSAASLGMRPLVDGVTIHGPGVAFVYREGPLDPLLGCAWRIADHVMFP